MCILASWILLLIIIQCFGPPLPAQYTLAPPIQNWFLLRWIFTMHDSAVMEVTMHLSAIYNIIYAWPMCFLVVTDKTEVVMTLQ